MLKYIGTCKCGFTRIEKDKPSLVAKCRKCGDFELRAVETLTSRIWDKDAEDYFVIFPSGEKTYNWDFTASHLYEKYQNCLSLAEAKKLRDEPITDKDVVDFEKREIEEDEYYENIM